MAARDKYLGQRNNIQAGESRNTDTPLTRAVQEFVKRFLQVTQLRVDGGELPARSYAKHKRVRLCQLNLQHQPAPLI